jgi:hypothetical protein
MYATEQNLQKIIDGKFPVASDETVVIGKYAEKSDEYVGSILSYNGPQSLESAKVGNIGFVNGKMDGVTKLLVLSSVKVQGTENIRRGDLRMSNPSMNSVNYEFTTNSSSSPNIMVIDGAPKTIINIDFIRNLSELRGDDGNITKNIPLGQIVYSCTLSDFRMLRNIYNEIITTIDPNFTWSMVAQEYLLQSCGQNVNIVWGQLDQIKLTNDSILIAEGKRALTIADALGNDAKKLKINSNNPGKDKFSNGSALSRMTESEQKEFVKKLIAKQKNRPTP